MKQINYEKLLKSMTCKKYPESVCYGEFSVATDLLRLVVVEKPGACDYDKTKKWPNWFPEKQGIETMFRREKENSVFFHINCDTLKQELKEACTDRKKKVIPAFFSEKNGEVYIRYFPQFSTKPAIFGKIKVTPHFNYSGDIIKGAYPDIETEEGFSFERCTPTFNLKFFYDAIKHLNGIISIGVSNEGGLKPLIILCQDAEIYIMPLRI